MRTTKVMWIIGAIAALGFLLGIQQDLPWLRLISKPIPVLCMAAWLWPQRQETYNKWIFWGLLASVAGDILLEVPANLFVAGLLAFLVAHLFYIAAYLQDSRQLSIPRAIPFMAYGVGLCGFLFGFGKVGALQIPVAVYALVICSMMWRAASRFGVQSIGKWSLQAAMWGAVVFALSDSMIAINKFYAPFPGARFAIILTYWAGQIGIVASILHRKK